MPNDEIYTVEEKQFIDFLEYYKEDFYLPSHVIAENIKGETILPTDRGRNQFEMYSLDEICQSCECFQEGDYSFTPKTTDAIWYKKCEDDFYIFLIEFKGDYLCKYTNKCTLIDLKDDMETLMQGYREQDDEYKKINSIITRMEKVIDKYSDKLLNGLAVKPLETVTVSLPLIYEEYFEKNKDSVNWMDIREFLRESIIVYRLVTISENYTSNRHRDRAKSYRCSSFTPIPCNKYAIEEEDQEPIKTYEANLSTYYKRFKESEVIDYYDFLENIEFNNFIKNYLM